MPSSKQLVFIPSIPNGKCLLWSKRGDTVCLRQYTPDGVEIVERLRAQQAEMLLAEPGSRVERQSCFNKIQVSQLTFWHQLIASQNIMWGLAPADEKDKLQALFKLRCLRPLVENEGGQLTAVFSQWLRACSKIVDKKSSFNRYDGISTSDLFGFDKGMGWQSYLLEASRPDGRVAFIETGTELTAISVASIELTLTISAKDNPFFPGTQSAIEPDGLGIRPDGFLTVLEVKGPSDEKDLLGPLLQATCGAIAVVAKKAMLTEIARTASGLRPRYRNARVPKIRSVGIHILTAKKKKNGRLEPWSPLIEELCNRVLKAFPQLKYIAYSFIAPEETDAFTKLHVDHLVTLS